ncbi:MAG TPA: pilus assembly protein PilP [Syntrophales bacterium]|nr:pilus assembly protein PilP [Syntrophales bacterium]
MDPIRKRLRKNRLLAASLVIAFLLALSATAAMAAAPPAPKPPEAKPEEPSAAAPPEKPEYRYDPRGKIDPFKPFVRLEVPTPSAKKGPEKKLTGALTPLQRVSLEKVRVTGVAGSSTKRIAMVEDGVGKAYIVYVGTLMGMNEGRVIQILPDRVIVEEKLEGSKGKERSHRVALKLHKEEGEGRP